MVAPRAISRLAGVSLAVWGVTAISAARSPVASPGPVGVGGGSLDFERRRIKYAISIVPQPRIHANRAEQIPVTEDALLGRWLRTAKNNSDRLADELRESRRLSKIRNFRKILAIQNSSPQKKVLCQFYRKRSQSTYYAEMTPPYYLSDRQCTSLDPSGVTAMSRAS
jgi:hypothetical protein